MTKNVDDKSNEELEQLDKELVEAWKQKSATTKIAIFLYAVVLSLTTMAAILYAVGLLDQPPPTWVLFMIYTPAALFLFVEYLKSELYFIVGEATKDAMAELIEELEDQLPTEEDQDRIEALLDAEPKGKA